MRNKIYNIEDVFEFGRNKGKTIEELLKENPGYVDWVIRNVESFALSHNAFQQAKIITEGKSFSKEEAEFERRNKITVSLLRNQKIYGWSFDFNDEELIRINQQKILKHQNEEANNNFIHKPNEDDTDWSNYNDDLDMDQQSADFWNQY